MNMTSIFAPITKSVEQDDGSILVYGKATDGGLDSDLQRCDPVWLSAAMPKWFNNGLGGNVREQHDPHRAIGKALEHEIANDGHYVTAKIVDPVAVAKTRAGVFTGFSIGIRSPKLSKSVDAPNGIIDGGDIVELSLCDRPSNPSCLLTLVKAAKPGMQVKAVDFDSTRMLVKCEELTFDDSVEKSADVETVTLSADETPVEVEETKSVETDEVTDAIATAEGLQAGHDFVTEATKTVDQGEPDEAVEVPETATKAVEFDRDAALELISKTVANADAGLGQDESGDISGALQAITIIADLIQNEAQALGTTPAQGCDIDLLMQAVHALRIFNCREAKEQAGIDPGSMILMAAEADVEKAKYSADDLRDMLKSGKAFKNPDGEPSYPIGDKDDLSKAIKAVGRGSGDHDSIRAYIVRRAKALGASDMIPEDWSSSGSNKAADVNLVIDGDASGAVEALNQTSDELKSVEKTITVTGDVNKGAGDFLRYLIDALTQVADEGEPVLDKNFEPDLVKGFDDKTVAYGVAFLFKAIASGIEKSDTTLNKSVKAVVETATESTAKSVSDLMERLEKVESMATPGGPALRRTEVERAQSRKSELTREVMRFKALSNSAVDNDLRRGYAAKAAQLETEAKAL